MSNVGSESLHRKIGDIDNIPKIFPSFQKLIAAECPLRTLVANVDPFSLDFNKPFMCRQVLKIHSLSHKILTSKCCNFEIYRRVPCRIILTKIGLFLQTSRKNVP